MATSPTNVFQIPDGPHNPGQNLLSEKISAIAASEPAPQRSSFGIEKVRQTEYTPEVKFLVDVSGQQVYEQKKALEKNRLQKANEKRGEKAVKRLLGQPTRPLPTTLKSILTEESVHRIEAVLGTKTPNGLKRYFYQDTRANYSNEELARDSWPDQPSDKIEWVYAQEGPTPTDNITLRYTVLPTHVRKGIHYYDNHRQPHMNWAPLIGPELDHFQGVVLRHYQVVSEGIYGNQARQFDESIREASQEILAQQVKTGQEAVRQSITPESTNEKIRQRYDAIVADLDETITDLHEEIELEAVEGSMLAQAPMDFESEDTLAYVERLVEEEYAAKNYIDGSKVEKKGQADLAA